MKLIRNKSLNQYILTPCGECQECKNAHKRQWAVRAMHEYMAFRYLNPKIKGCFLTLTYDAENLPKDLSLHPEHLDLFINALRKALKRRGFKGTLRYMNCGEYGNADNDPYLYLKEVGRPHYHMVIFNWYPDDAFPLYFEKGLFRSPLIEKLWTRGNSSVGDCNDKTCMYVASYVQKKRKGKEKCFYKKRELVPEFCKKSQGLGRDFLNISGEQFKALGYIPYNGFKCPLFRYYEGKLYLTEQEKEKRKNDKLEYINRIKKDFERSLDRNSYLDFHRKYFERTGYKPRWEDWVEGKEYEAKQERERQLKRKAENSMKKTELK